MTQQQDNALAAALERLDSLYKDWHSSEGNWNREFINWFTERISPHTRVRFLPGSAHAGRTGRVARGAGEPGQGPGVTVILDRQGPDGETVVWCGDPALLEKMPSPDRRSR